MRIVQGNVVYSPHDVTAYLAGDYVAWMDRLYFELKQKPSLPYDPQLKGIPIEKDEADADLELIKNKGFAHEAAYCQQLKQTVEVSEIPDAKNAVELTLAAMKAGSPVIFQGALKYESFAGRPDFLVRADGKSRLGNGHYLPRDTKLARSVRCEHAVQLCAYAEMLEGLQGVRPQFIEFILGDRSLVRLPVAGYRGCGVAATHRPYATFFHGPVKEPGQDFSVAVGGLGGQAAALDLTGDEGRNLGRRNLLE